MSKLPIQTTKKPAVTITRNAIKKSKLVYLALANKPIKYHNGEKSRIVYIGTTKTGAGRIAASAAAKAQDILLQFGVTQLDFFVVTCKPKPNVKTWRKLERGLLLAFKAHFGKPPLANNHGAKMKWTDELKYFTRHRLDGVIADYSKDIG